MVKTFKNALLWNQIADDLETWYVALVTRVLPSLCKWWPWVVLDLFYSEVKFGPFCFCMGKCLSFRLGETIEACEVKASTYSQINEYTMLWQPKVKVIHWPLSKVTQIQHFQTSFPQKNTRSFEAKFRMEPPWDVEMKICSNVPCHMIKMASMPIYGKKLRNQEADDLETWCTGSGTEVLPNLFKWWLWVDHDHFYDMVKFVS